MLIVTGATGHLGSLIVNRLLERVPAGRIGVSVRDAGRAVDLAERGCESVRETSPNPAPSSTPSKTPSASWSSPRPSGAAVR
ncbi:SDR family oxidoreductase [Nonomuraea thailandensis]